MIRRINYRILFLIALFLFMTYRAHGQESRVIQQTPSFALKSNLLYDAVTNANLGLEFKLGHKWTFDLPVSYNGWTFHHNKKWKHILVQPSVRWWTCEAFNGHFFGLHGHYAYYNVGNIRWGGLKFPDNIDLRRGESYRYQGWLAGAGLSYGYSTYLGKRFNLEFEVGVGWAYLHYDKYRCAKCGEKIGADHKNYFGPTKAAITLVYLLK